MTKPASAVVATAAALVAAALPAAAAEPPWTPDTSRTPSTALASTGRVLYVAAHPDDENTRLLAYLANGRHLPPRTCR